MHEPRRILVAQTIYLGDLILTLPLLTALRGRYPSAEIDLLVQKDLSDIVAAHPATGGVLSMDRSGKHKGIRGFLRLVREVRTKEYDLAIVLPGSIRTALVALLAGIPRRIGWDPGKRISGQMKNVRFPAAMRSLPFIRPILMFEFLYRLSRPIRVLLPPLFTDNVAIQPDEHMALSLLEPMRLLNAPVSAELTSPWLPAGVGTQAATTARNPPAGKGSVVLAPGAGQATKRWPEERFGELARLLAADGFTLFILGGVADRDLAGRIAGLAGSPRVVSVAGALTPLESMALIRTCVAVVANDSAPVHMASAMGAPTVVLFGPTVPSFGFGPLARGSRVLERTGLACRPCTLYGSDTCPVGTHECLTSINVEDVRREVLAIAAASAARLSQDAIGD